MKGVVVVDQVVMAALVVMTTVLAVVVLVTRALCISRPWWRERGSGRERREDGLGPWSGTA